MLLNKEFLNRQFLFEHSDSAEDEEERLLKRNKILYNSTKRFDIFLSHSNLDRKTVISTVELFVNAGYSVYVDWMIDSELDRSMVNEKTASVIRKRMNNCRCLAYVATENISKSKWCPWELGYVDGNKDGRCAILPVMETAKDSFIGQEYLGLYPYIDYSTYRETEEYDFWVNDPKAENNYVKLRNWLDGEEPYPH